jgi:hypothetical protein
LESGGALTIDCSTPNVQKTAVRNTQTNEKLLKYDLETMAEQEKMKRNMY